MLRLRFASGLTLGLALGVPSGALIALLILPGRAADENAAPSAQVQELTHKLEAATEERQRAEHQLEQFQKLAEQMTTSFNNLEARFKALEQEQRLREARLGEARPSPPTPGSAAPPALPPPAPQPPPAAPGEPAAGGDVR
jgi:TolA-binding protein